MSTKWSKKGITAVRLREFFFSNASSQSTGAFSFFCEVLYYMNSALASIINQVSQIIS